MVKKARKKFNIELLKSIQTKVYRSLIATCLRDVDKPEVQKLIRKFVGVFVNKLLRDAAPEKLINELLTTVKFPKESWLITQSGELKKRLIKDYQYFKEKLNEPDIKYLQAKKEVMKDLLSTVKKNKKTMLLSGAIEFGRKKPGVIPILDTVTPKEPPSTGNFAKTQEFYKLINELRDSVGSGGIGQEYAEANRKFNNTWQVFFNGKDAVTEERLVQLNQIQKIINSLQLNSAKFSTGKTAPNEKELKAETEMLYNKLIEIRNQAANGTKEERSIPLKQVCERWIEKIETAQLLPRVSNKQQKI
jgi:hypothetical protein